MSRFTIRSRRATIARRDVRTYGLTRAGSWRIDCLAARLDLGRPVHRERVRFGAWRARPSRALPWGEVPPCACCQIPWAIPDEATRAAEARSGAGVGTAEGPAGSGRSQTYKPDPEHEHVWTFWGDDPYMVCAVESCDAIVDALSGRRVR